MNLRGILSAHRQAVDEKETEARKLQTACQEIDRMITYVIQPIFEEAARQISEGGFDVKVESETRLFETDRSSLKFAACCVLTAGKSIPASTLTYDGNPRTGIIEFRKVVGGLKTNDEYALNAVTTPMVEKEVEEFVVEVFPTNLI